MRIEDFIPGVIFEYCNHKCFIFEVDHYDDIMGIVSLDLCGGKEYVGFMDEIMANSCIQINSKE